MKARMTIFAPTAAEARQELLAIARSVGEKAKVEEIRPQGSDWLVTYTATPGTIRKMEEQVS